MVLSIINLFMDMTNNLCCLYSHRKARTWDENRWEEIALSCHISKEAKRTNAAPWKDYDEWLIPLPTVVFPRMRIRATNNTKLLRRMKILLIFLLFRYFFCGERPEKPTPYSWHNNLIDYSAWSRSMKATHNINISCSLRVSRSRPAINTIIKIYNQVDYARGTHLTWIRSI